MLALLTAGQFTPSITSKYSIASMVFSSSPMAFCYKTSMFALSLFLLVCLISQAKILQQRALVLPVSKHAFTLQYVTRIHQRTPLVPISIVLDLGGPFLWVGCDHSSYNSSSYRQACCHSIQCSLAQPTVGCSSSNTCILFLQNIFTSKVSVGDLSEDVLSLRATDGENPTFMVSVPRFLFLCAPDFLLEGLASGTEGIAGLGHSRIGLPTQLATAFNFSRIFALCLSPSTNADGVIFFGDGPYVMLPGIDISKLLIYTPLIFLHKNRASRYHRQLWRSHEYFIRVKYIRINGKTVSLNSSLLSMDNNLGFGRTKISTVNPYSILETSIYTSFTKIFIEEAMAANATRVKPVAPFDICFSTSPADGALYRPPIPIIDLMLQDEKVFWRIFETNSMVPVGGDVMCLGFLNGGLSPRTSIVIGGHQLEDNFLQFDLVSSRLGFTSSLLLRQTTCASFNFTPSD